MAFHKYKVGLRITAVNPLESPGYFYQEVVVPQVTGSAMNQLLIGDVATGNAINDFITDFSAVVEGNVEIMSIGFEDEQFSAASGNEYPSTKAVISVALEKNNVASAKAGDIKIPAPAAGMFNGNGSVNTNFAGLVSLETRYGATVTDTVDTLPMYPRSDDQRITGFIGGKRV